MASEKTNIMPVVIVLPEVRRFHAGETTVPSIVQCFPTWCPLGLLIWYPAHNISESGKQNNINTMEHKDKTDKGSATWPERRELLFKRH